MKKAIAVFAILLAVSLVGTVALGLSIGKEALQGGELREVLGNYSLWNDTDWNDHTQGRLYYDETKPLDVGANPKIDMDILFGEVNITPSADATASVRLRIYTRNEKEVPISLLAETRPDGSVGIEMDREEMNFGTVSLNAIWDIILPAQKISELELDMNAGKLAMQTFEIGNLDITINAGDANLSGVRADEMELDVKAGRLTLTNGSRALQTMDVSVAAGAFEYEVPADQGFTLKSKVTAGAFEHRNFGSALQETKDSKTPGFRDREMTYGDRSCRITIDVSAGSVVLKAA